MVSMKSALHKAWEASEFKNKYGKDPFLYC
jgi:hypothetical protein